MLTLSIAAQNALRIERAQETEGGGRGKVKHLMDITSSSSYTPANPLLSRRTETVIASVPKMGHEIQRTCILVPRFWDKGVSRVCFRIGQWLIV